MLVRPYQSLVAAATAASYLAVHALPFRSGTMLFVPTRSERALSLVVDIFMMRLEQIDHVALRCASPEATKAWYVSTLGFEHVFPGRWSGIPIVLRLGSTYITLFLQKANEQALA